MKKSFAVLATVISVVGCSNNASFDSQNAQEKWNRYHAESISQKQVGEGQSLVVFYREGALHGEAMDVYVNKDYQASLLASSFSPVVVCSGEAMFSVSYVEDNRFTRYEAGKPYSLTQGGTHYFKLVKSPQGQLSFEAVPAEQAKAELRTLKGEIRHTLSRVNSKKSCAPKTETTHTLSASALWGLAQYSYADMSEQGKKELEAFAKSVINQPNISHITVSGFTDPEASEAYNLTLSQRRAETVRQALIQAGVTQTINATGYGESRLVVEDCALKHTTDRTARTACNQPNRRVEISTFGK